MVSTPEAAVDCDSLYVSAFPLEAAIACAGRLVRERASGLRVVVLSLFDGESTASGHERWQALAGLGVERAALDLPCADRRDSRHRALRSVVEERHAPDEETVHRAAEVLTNLAHRGRARQIYAPLAVGGHIDHRLAHEAARAAFTSGEGRNVFFYEERPEAFVPGALRVRLAQMGARLPPAAAGAPGAASLPAYAFRFHVGPEFRGVIDGRWQRLSSAWTALRQWRRGRAWQPARALGPRLQPLTYATAPEDLAPVQELEGSWKPEVARLASAYVRRLAPARHAERYWLLLPPLHNDGQETDQRAR